MRVAIVGGGPGGLYAALLLRKAMPHARVTLWERNALEDTFGFGVVFSEATEEVLAATDPEAHRAMDRAMARWDAIDVHVAGEVVRSHGHGFSGVSRQVLLRLLSDRARALGVEIQERTVAPPLEQLAAGHDLVIAADGANSGIRDAHREAFGTTIDLRPNRFVWLGTSQAFPSFAFWFVKDRHGLWRAHAYQYARGESTFIVEATEETWKASGLADDDEPATLAHCQALFAEALGGHPLRANKSVWRQFPTVRNTNWVRGNVVLLGDAAHTAHFSIGSGTRLAMEDAVALVEELGRGKPVAESLSAYEAARRPPVESLQRAAQASLEWFEEAERYDDLDPLDLTYSLLTRSLRITHENLRLRDPAFVERVERRYEERAWEQVASRGSRVSSPEPADSQLATRDSRPTLPMLTPFRVRDLVLPNRIVVSAMCMYSATDGLPNDWHLVHLGSRAVGGAGLVMAEMTDVSPEGRITPGCAGLWTDEQAAGWGRIVRFIHGHTASKVGIQLSHAGRKAATCLPWEGGSDRPLPEGDWPIMAPSPIPWTPENQVPAEMTRADMDQVREDFVAATHRVVTAGFDLLELHCAHGYLLGTFISPLTNTRTDAFGGSLENRLRYPLEVLVAIRAAWPQDRPLSVRISASDWARDGLSEEESVEVARQLAAHGADIVDVSTGQTVAHQRPRYGRAWQTPFSDRIRHEAGVATMAVGNISTHDDVNAILAAGRADLVAMARAHLWDPYWTLHAAHDAGQPLRWPSPYETMDRYTPRPVGG